VPLKNMVESVLICIGSIKAVNDIMAARCMLDN
jgi:hypothetical protein